MKELTVNAADGGQRLNKYLIKYLETAPASFVYKMLRKKNITLNGKKAKGDEIISQGDSVKLFLSDETISKFKSQKKASNINLDDRIELKILYQDDNILAVHKPAGILSQKAKENDISINEMIISYCETNHICKSSAEITFKPSVCNRLDRNTSGIILAGISLKGTQTLSKLLKDRTGDKYYFTIVKGKLDQKRYERAYIVKDEKVNISNVINIKEYQALSSQKQGLYNYIETYFEPISSSDKYTLVRIKLITGKSHQIRAHLRHLGFPVVGDSKYGDISINRYFRDKYKLKNHLLHAGYFGFENIVIRDTLPEYFLKICQGEHIEYEDLYGNMEF